MDDFAGREQQPPHEAQAEQPVLGALLVDPESVDKVRAILASDDFYIEANRWCFQAIENVREKGESADQVAVSAELRSMGKLEQVGGAAHLAYLIENTPTSVHVEYYAEIVAKCSRQRNQM
jgi:replicative DNA helicase